MCLKTFLSDLAPDQLDMVAQELLSTSLECGLATHALVLTFNSTPEGFFIRCIMLMEGRDEDFEVSKLLFGLTKNILIVDSSDTFIAYLRLIAKILRERVKHHTSLLTI